MNQFASFLRSPVRPAVDRLLKIGAAVRARRFAERDPYGAQREIFARLLVRGAQTRFGRDYGLAELSGLHFEAAYRRYQEQVPIRTYQDFWDDYFREGFAETNGQKSFRLDNVTWPGTIPFFCETSGTTAPTKFIPFSQEMFAENRRAALDLASCYLAGNPESRLLHGKLLYMAGNTDLTPLGNGAWSGDMSAITLRHRPLYLRPFVAPDPRISALPWEEKLEALADLLLNDRSVRAISGVPPWILLLLKRCAELGRKPLAELLPNLELIIHGGTSMKPYRKEFDELLGVRETHFLELLPSSEGFMAFQPFGEEEMRLTPYYGVFFEFVPFEALNERGVPAPDARAIPLEQVEAGKRYAVILTTCAGLWRYHIGDTIRFTSLVRLSIEFTGRDKFLDRFEEKVTQGEVEEAVASLNRMGGFEVREFIVGPLISERRHCWILAMPGGSRTDENELAEALDHCLRVMNADYATFRNQGRINAPRVMIVDEELIYSWSKVVRGKLGGQSKIPHIDPTLDGEMVRSLIEFNAKEHTTQCDLARS